MERLQKLIATAGVASRRGAEQLILDGLVSLNGSKVLSLGTKADLAVDTVLVKGTPLPRPRLVVYALNKPKGVVCSTKKQAQEKLVTELVPPHPPVYPVGRLDRESEGLILLTNNGELANQLTHPSYLHAKEYTVLARWQKDKPKREADWVSKHLLKGVRLGDGLAKADQVIFKTNEHGGLVLILTVHEGRQHLIRRMCATIGLDVLRLTRTRLSNLSLRGIKSGQYRILSELETKSLI